MKNISKLLLVVAFAAVLVYLPTMVAKNDFGSRPDVNTTLEKREAIRNMIAEMRAEIEANNYSYTVGYNPAMQYSLEQLCGAVPELARPLSAPTFNMGEVANPESLPAAYISPYVTPIKNQGSCGSCWAFGAIAAFESSIYKKDNVVVDLSEQYVVSCNDDGWGCSGGWWSYDLFVNPGVVLESCFPYAAADLPCDHNCTYPYQALGFGFAGPEHEVAEIANIKQAVMDYGGVNTCVFVDSTFQAYTGGVMDNCKRNPRRVNHMVSIVGWDDSLGAWKIKNSWGTGWGDNGYIWMTYGCNLIGYGTSYVVY
jgi:cathepsin L